MIQKESKNWYIAATHFLTAGFVIPVFVSFVFGYIFFPMDENGHLINGSISLLMSIVSAVVGTITIWFGVMYSSRFLKKRYMISDVSRIIKLSTIYFAASFIVFEAGFIIQGIMTQIPMNELLQYIGIDIVIGLIGIYVFYRASVRYLHC